MNTYCRPTTADTIAQAIANIQNAEFGELDEEQLDALAAIIAEHVSWADRPQSLYQSKVAELERSGYSLDEEYAMWSPTRVIVTSVEGVNAGQNEPLPCWEFDAQRSAKAAAEDSTFVCTFTRRFHE